MRLGLAKVSGLALLLVVMAPMFALAANEFDKPVAVTEDGFYRFQVLSESGYVDERGRRIIDILEGYQVNLALSVDTPEGQPVIGLEPAFNLDGTSQLIPPGESTQLTTTDESGILEFGITAGKQGMDKLTVSFGPNEVIIFFNIISLQIKEFATDTTYDVDLRWSELMKATLDFFDGELEVTFPVSIQSQDGDVVSLWGFMMPLDADLKQKHFLMTSSPPHCFFHIPGGAAGVVEVFSEQGIETSWEPVLLQGTLKLVENSTTGVIYQLENAEIIDE